jgi:hypothetical protein
MYLDTEIRQSDCHLMRLERSDLDARYEPRPRSSSSYPWSAPELCLCCLFSKTLYTRLSGTCSSHSPALHYRYRCRRRRQTPRPLSPTSSSSGGHRICAFPLRPVVPYDHFLASYHNCSPQYGAALHGLAFYPRSITVRDSYHRSLHLLHDTTNTYT